MNPKRFLGTALVLSAVSLSSTTIWAHGGASGIVKERMDLMSDMKKSMKSLSSMFKGEIQYDASAVRNAAKALEKNAGEEMTKLFPEGSVHGPSEAKMNIWQDWQRFQQMSDDLKVYSRALSEAADRYNPGNAKPAAANMMGMGSMMGSGHMMGENHMMGGSSHSPEHLSKMPADMLFKMVTDTCSSCHTRFRLEK